jgi:BED zinc finger
VTIFALFLQDDDDADIMESRLLRVPSSPPGPVDLSQRTTDSAQEAEEDSPPVRGIRDPLSESFLNLVRPENAKSCIWKHFKVQFGKKKSKGYCNYCDMGVSRGNSQTTSNLKQHLRRHKDEYAEFVGDEAASNSQGGGVYRGQPKARVIKDALIEMMVEGHIPFTMLKLTGLTKLMGACGIVNRIPDKRTVQHRMSHIEAETRGKLKDLVASKKVCITCDGWKANTGIDYLGITACWVDDSWKLQTLTLDCTIFPGRHFSARIAARVKYILNGYVFSFFLCFFFVSLLFFLFFVSHALFL